MTNVFKKAWEIVIAKVKPPKEEAIEQAREALQRVVSSENESEITVENFLHFLSCGMLEEAIQVGNMLQKNIVLSDIKGYKEAVGKGIFSCFFKKRIDVANAFYRKFGYEADIKPILNGFGICIESFDIKGAEAIMKAFPEIDFTHSIIEGLIFFLRQGLVLQSREIFEFFDRRIDFISAPEYPAAVKQGIIQCLHRDQGKDSRRMRAVFMPALDLGNDPEYLTALKLFRHAENRRYQEWVMGGSFDLAAFLSMRDRSCPDLEEQLVSFESCVVYTVDYFRDRMREKCAELTPASGDLAELSEQDQAKLQVFAANLHDELSFKIRAIASPELIEAYLEQNTSGAGSEFLTQAA